MLRTIRKVAQETPLTGRVVDSLVDESPRNNAPSIQAVTDNIYYSNLLFNGDFNCWQRGTTFTKSDSWKLNADMWSATCGVEKVDNGVKLIFDGTLVGSAKRTFRQFIPDSKRHSGKKAAIGISIDNKLYELKGTFLEDDSRNGIEQTIDGLVIFLGWSSSKQMYTVQIYTANVKTVVINYIDLFEGEVVYKHRKEDDQIALLRCEKYIVTAPVNFVGYTNGEGLAMYIYNEKILNLAKSVSLFGERPQMTLRFDGNTSTVLPKQISIESGNGEIGIGFTQAYSSIKYRTVSGYFTKKLIFSCEPL